MWSGRTNVTISVISTQDAKHNEYPIWSGVWSLDALSDAQMWLYLSFHAKHDEYPTWSRVWSPVNTPKRDYIRHFNESLQLCKIYSLPDLDAQLMWLVYLLRDNLKTRILPDPMDAQCGTILSAACTASSICWITTVSTMLHPVAYLGIAYLTDATCSTLMLISLWLSELIILFHSKCLRLVALILHADILISWNVVPFFYYCLSVSALDIHSAWCPPMAKHKDSEKSKEQEPAIKRTQTSTGFHKAQDHDILSTSASTVMSQITTIVVKQNGHFERKHEHKDHHSVDSNLAAPPSQPANNAVWLSSHQRCPQLKYRSHRNLKTPGRQCKERKPLPQAPKRQWYPVLSRSCTKFLVLCWWLLTMKLSLATSLAF